MSNPVRLSPVVSRVLQVAGTAVAFAILNRAGWYFQIDRGVSILYPAAAVDVVACLSFGVWGALGIIVGCLIRTPWQPGETLQLMATSALLNVIEGLIPYLIFRVSRTLSRDLHNFRSLVAFIVFGCVVNSAVMGVAGNLMLIPPPVRFVNVLTWWVSDFSAVLLLGSPILAFGSGLLERFGLRHDAGPRRRLISTAAITGTIILLGWGATTAIQTSLANRLDQERQLQEQIWTDAKQELSQNTQLDARALFNTVDAENRRLWKVYSERRQRIRAVSNLMHQTLLVILLLAGVNLIDVILRPLKQMHEEVVHMRETEIFDAERVDSPLVELRALADTLAATATELAARESALREQTTRAVAASNAKSEFLAKMSHELRTPLNSIIGFSDMILDRRDSMALEKLDSFVDNISRSAHNLLSMINDLLDVAKVEAGRMDFNYANVDLRHLVTNAVATTTPLFRSKQQRLEVEMPDRPMRVRVDPGRTEQILLNLLSNAHKFSAVETVVRIVATVEEHSCVVEVRDQGIGIREEDQAFVFEDFAQLHAVAGTHGTGLGLGLARTFAEAQGGSLTLESKLGRGSTLTVRFPLVVALSVIA